ncbi:MAG: ATP synthase F1 subunit gamma [Acidobacteriota bacterium]
MASIRDLRRRIRSVQSTKQITRAMKLVAASKLRKAQETMERARPYAAGVKSLLGKLKSAAGEVSHPLLQERDGNKTLMLVVSSDRGLCGGFNANLLKGAMNALKERSDREVHLEICGKKAADFFKSRSWEVRKHHADVLRDLSPENTRAVAHSLIQGFLDDGYDEVLVVSNRFKSVMAQDLVVERLLPAGQDDGDEAAASETGDYIYEPSAAELLGSIVPRSVETIVHQVLLESYAAEMGARMVAMETATKNASEMIDKLTLIMNRKRQAAITTEIIEIVSGAAALEG